MAYLLNIETATKNCSVSLAKDGKTVALKELNDGGYSHAEKLHEFIKTVLVDTNISISDLDAIAVSKGPGSYTGLRIGVSAAKGLCFALNVPLISVNTMQSLAQSVTFKNSYVIPLLDARRMEVYSAVYKNNNSIRNVQAEIIDETSFNEYLDKNTVYFLGDGAQKCKALITHKNAIFIDGKFPSANEMSILSYQKYKKNDIEDVAYFEPFYLKDFVVTTAKKLI
ncbi:MULTISPECIES: tRNA (adenosine(37)-N6)-threonylcarbamoyltransferase complex dimerization subunit type 1 TsaB [Flavobacteriaceae]|uniref:tRNA (Adenosine(37)-N6)-threonylcarbamoyltransferase complex dimerization subunit type 1 TsaB n=2 Tax=Flavobacteriaceae TaxID=49546 RepID=A0A4Y8AQX7_9FLAO|nr:MULTISPECIES: tRNA (adenosine(37)-N6)-threonylcarbamoyltransferase complex dimerization subunit type 1 TsaB [Flavobacteriaceae]TEW73610.1 tRNA (adenosine(37)-N6)-threonylcarbamoyltransferase complex dimerization subunit type 1 TsaB [Gramella jeungdoensis]GGK36059.1 tRNA (adenosine(37)-N6)-threonylcarbamoyltransferase complex dimerization subunit type 1 TsaB [Lutibacter litoralis]